MAYKGFQISLPVGMQGFSGSRNPTQMQPGHLAAVEGLSLEGGILQKEGGAQHLNSVSLGGTVVIGGFNWSPVAGAYRDIIFLEDGRLLKDDGSGSFSTTLASALNASRNPPPVFVTGGGETVGAARKLFIFSGVNQVKVVSGDGATAADISDPAADWSSSFPTFGVQHVGRMFAGGNSNDPHRIYASLTADNEDFVSSGFLSFPIYPGEGDGLVGGISFRGVLVLFKYPKGIYILDTRDPSAANWNVSKLSGAVGGINHNSIIQIENDVLYMDEGGNIHLLSATNDLGDINTSNISQVADLRPYIQDVVNLTTIKRTVGIWYAARRQAWFTMPTLGNSDNDLRLAVDFNRPDLGPRFIPTRRDEAPAIWLRKAADGLFRPAAGAPSGRVWLLEDIARNKEGVGYPLRFETASTDLSFADPSLANKTKTGQFLELLSEPRGSWNLTIEIYWDDQLTDTVQFNMGQGGAALGSFTLDVDALTSNTVAPKRQRISGSGRRFKLIGYNTGIDEDVAIAGFYLSFVVGDERTKT